MPRHRPPEKFPSIYYDLFNKVLAKGSHIIENLTRKQAHSLRFQLNSFRRSLQVHLPDVSRQYDPISISLRHEPAPGVTHVNPEDATDYTLVLTLANQTPEAELIANSLGLDKLAQTALPSEVERVEVEPTIQTSTTPTFDSALGSVLSQMRGEPKDK